MIHLPISCRDIPFQLTLDKTLASVKRESKLTIKSSYIIPKDLYRYRMHSLFDYSAISINTLIPVDSSSVKKMLESRYFVEISFHIHY